MKPSLIALIGVLSGATVATVVNNPKTKELNVLVAQSAQVFVTKNDLNQPALLVRACGRLQRADGGLISEPCGEKLFTPDGGSPVERFFQDVALPLLIDSTK